MASQYPPPQGGPSQPMVLHNPAANFVENRGPQYHPALYTPGTVQYDPSLTRFEPLSPPNSMQISSNLMIPDVPAPSPRSTPGPINGMDCWAEVFPRAMKRLSEEEPEPRYGQEGKWGIRDLTVWRDVQARLDMAQRQYDHHHTSKDVGQFRRKLRDMMDKCTVPVQNTARIINVDLAKPVLGAVNILLDVSDLYREFQPVCQRVHVTKRKRHIAKQQRSGRR